VHNRRELLSWLNPELDETHATRAGDLLDAVASYLEAAGPTRLLDSPPPFDFDPETASSYLPRPVELPELASGFAGSSPATAEPEWLSPAQLAALIRSGEVSQQEVLERFARRIELWEPVINSFVRVTLDPSSPATAGALGGVPIGVHDTIGTAGVPTTAGSRILADYVPVDDAEAWRRLSDAGAVLAGKLGTQEFAAGTSGENQWYGAVHNPWDPSRLAGGAAGGAGAAVAAGLISGAIATDPGGSIRVPAALCGVVGLKPTHGSIDRRGTIPLTWTTETVGVLARTVPAAGQLADLLLDGRALARYGVSCTDAATRGAGSTSVTLRVGVPTGWLAMGLDPAVERSYRDALAVFTELGATLVEVDLPDAGLIAPAHRAVAFSEASSIHEELLQTRASDYGDNIRDRQEAGRGMLASEYLKGYRLRGLFARQFSEVWRQVDLVAVPTSPVPAASPGTEMITTGPRGPEPVHTVYTRYSAPMSSLGLPALSVPCGFTPEGLPVGMQLCGPPHSEPLLFFAAGAYESATSWSLSRPSLAADPVSFQAAAGGASRREYT
jgi:aspartyl-tRNA(Asn)/glutamyl-tRNA(Gln) amidotransferase subunit A